MKTTFYLALDDGERSMIIRTLNSLRNRLIAQGKYIDGVVRLSFSAFSTMEEARFFIETFTEIYKELKKYVG